eukprot:scaffold406_cov57-Cylindrotheca_fusiformis.AAC.22
MQHHEEVEDEVWIYNGKDEVPPATVRRVKIAENVIEIFQIRHSITIGILKKKLLLSSSVQVIGKWAFFGCEIMLEVNSVSSRLDDDGEEKEELGIPSNVKSD